VNLDLLSAFSRKPARTAEPLLLPVRSDLLGSELRYYTCSSGQVFTSSSVSALARKLGKVTLHRPALAEALAFGLVHRDRTVFEEIRSIPAHSTLHPDGTLAQHPGPRPTREIADASQAVRLYSDRLASLILEAEDESRDDAIQLVGFTGGKDSRMIAALPKRDRARWHYVAISGKGDAEALGSADYAARLGLEHYRWVEWTSDYLDGDGRAPERIRRSAELANGIGAVSDFTLLRSAFESYRDSLQSRAPHAPIALWQGTLADGLIGPTWLAPPATNLWEAHPPRTTHLEAALPPETLAQFRDDEPFYRSNPFAIESTDPRDVSLLLRHFTKGRAYVCKALACFDDTAPNQLNPYLHPDLIDLSLRFAPELLASDAIRVGILERLGPDLSGPSAWGYRPPPYAESVFRALTDEANRCEQLEKIINPALAGQMRAGHFPALGPLPTTTWGPPAYRAHGEPVSNLRDYEHLLTYISLLNQLAEAGVAVVL
jgi:hypothetical protein